VALLDYLVMKLKIYQDLEVHETDYTQYKDNIWQTI
jgi:hypothetical protein